MKITMNNIVVKRKYIYRANIWRNNFFKLLIPISFFGSILGFIIGEDTVDSVALLLVAFLLMFLEILRNISIAIMMRFKNTAYLIEPRDYEITDELITIKFSHNIIATLLNDKKLKVIRKKK